MNDLSIRGYIINNFKNSSTEDMRKAVETALKSEDEEALPGMGVFFDIIWNNCSKEKQNDLLQILKDNLH